MNLTLLLPWFPIILAVGVGGRLLDRARGAGLGIVCAVFWIILVQALTGGNAYTEPIRIISIIAGCAAIVAMGAWSGEMGENRQASTTKSLPEKPASTPLPGTTTRTNDGNKHLEQFTGAMDQFDDWLEEHRNDLDPWPRFDEFIRGILYQICRATHVKPFRLLSEGDELTPLRESDPLVDVPRICATRGLVGEVLSTGRAFIADVTHPRVPVDQLKDTAEESMAWCFSITQGPRRIGVVTVGQLDIHPGRNEKLLKAVQQFISICWGILCEVCRSRSAGLHDPVSTLLTRESFLNIAENTLEETYRQGEPAAIAVIALEQLRQLNDSGRWEVADELVRETCQLMKQRVRADDQLGRFDGSRLVLLLRRVDNNLTSLILEQLMIKLNELTNDRSRWRAAIYARCGAVGTGNEKPSLRSMISDAVKQCQSAREQGLVLSVADSETAMMHGGAS